MKKILLTLTLALAVTLGVVVGESFVYAASHDVTEGESIQAAIDGASPGDTINIAAGTYTERIVVDKPLTIRGAQAGVDARDRSGAETTLVGPTSASAASYVVRVESVDVTIDGLTIQSEAPTDTFYGVQVARSADASGLKIVNNIVKDTGFGLRTEEPFGGVGARLNNLVVSQNAFRDNNRLNTSSSIFLGSLYEGDNVEISDNLLTGNDNGTADFKAAINIGSPVTTLENVRILNNQASNTGTFLVYRSVDGGQISGNVAGDAATPGRAGVYISLNTSNVAIQDNTLDGFSHGIRFSSAIGSGDPSSNFTVTGNTITGSTETGIILLEDAYTGTLQVSDNSITGNAVGIDNQNQAAATVDANDNWWGCEAGPGADGCDDINGVVLASSWYIDDGLTVTNLDVDDQDVPGVPNTGFVGSSSWSLLAAGLVAGIVVTGGAVYYRRSVN